MMIAIQNLQKRTRLNPQAILRTSRKIFHHEGIASVNLSIVFVSDRKIHSLNKIFLNEDHPTDVLSFDLSFHQPLQVTKAPPQKAGRRRQIKPSPINGEIIISTDTARRQAKEFHTSIEMELTLYLVHGILHLLGYDDHTPFDIRKMRQKESELMKLLKP